MTQNAYFSFLTHTKKLLLVTFYDPTAETGVSFGTHGKETNTEMGMDGKTDVTIEIVIKIESQAHRSQLTGVMLTWVQFWPWFLINLLSIHWICFQ